MKFMKHGIQSYYSAVEVEAYLRRINFPATSDGAARSASIATLELLVRLHLLAFPFDNSRLHYSANHDMDVSTDASYRRLVAKREGGSWCFGLNGLLMGVLRGLGYRTYAAPARVNKAPPDAEPDYGLLLHIVLLVQLDDLSTDLLGEAAGTHREPTTFMVDVGFGGNGIVRPIRLQSGQVVPGAAPPEEHRLVRALHPQSALEEDESNRQWVLQYRCGSHQADWTPLFLFYEYEHLPEDWVASSQWLCRYPIEPFKSNVIAIAYFVVENGEQSGEEPRSLGRLVMAGRRVQRRIGEQSKTVREFTTERERVQILKEDFGITVEEGEVSNMLATAAALRRE